MLLTLWALFTAIGMILIIIGFFRPEHTAQGLVGFLFLFFLSFPILNGELEVESGHNTTTTFTYDPDLNNTLLSTDAVLQYQYTKYSSHNFGYYMAVASALGFVVLIASIRKTKNWESGE